MDDNFLDADALAAIREAFTCEVISESQKDVEEDDPDWRYVSVSE